MHVHPTAVVADGAELGDGVRIGPHCYVGSRVRLGDGCALYAHVVLEGDTAIGPGCEFWPHAVVGTSAQHRDPTDPGRLVIGEHNRFRECVTVNVGSPVGHGVTEIGDHNLFLAGSHVAHDARIGSHITLTNSAMAAGHTTIDDRSVIGAMVGLHQFVRVGKLAMIGAGAMVPRDAPPYSLVQGDRARIRGVNLIGMRRAGIRQRDVAVVKRAYRLLFWRTEVMVERIARVRDEYSDHALVADILNFMQDSHRGVLMARGRADPNDVDDPAHGN